MSDGRDDFGETYHQDWRIQLGLGLTFTWLVLGGLFISINVSWSAFVRLPIAELGNFLEGAFAPLAFLWVVIGLFIQQKVLAENNKELRRNNIQSEKQTQAIAATEMNARQETFFKISDATRRQIGAISGMLLISSKGPQADGTFEETQLMELWNQFAGGDSEVFSRRFLIMAGSGKVDVKDMLYGTEIRRRHTDNIILNFDRIFRLAKDCDTANIISDSLLNSAHGLLCNRMRELHPEIKFEVLESTNSSSYLKQIAMMETRSNAEVGQAL